MEPFDAAGYISDRIRADADRDVARAWIRAANVVGEEPIHVDRVTDMQPRVDAVSRRANAHRLLAHVPLSTIDVLLSYIRQADSDNAYLAAISPQGFSAMKLHFEGVQKALGLLSNDAERITTLEMLRDRRLTILLTTEGRLASLTIGAQRALELPHRSQGPGAARMSAHCFDVLATCNLGEVPEDTEGLLEWKQSAGPVADKVLFPLENFPAQAAPTEEQVTIARGMVSYLMLNTPVATRTEPQVVEVG